MKTFARSSRFNINERPGGHLDDKLQGALTAPGASRHVVFEYLFGDGHGDRHEGNILFDGESRIMHIDFGREFPVEAQFDPRDSALSSFMVKAYFPTVATRQFDNLFYHHAAYVRLDRGFIRNVVSQRASILQLAHQRGLDERHGLARRINVLEHLANLDHEPSMLDLYWAGREADQRAGYLEPDTPH